MDRRDPFHEGVGVVHQRLAADAERRVRAQRLHEERHAQVAAGLERGLAPEHRVARVEDVFESEQLLGEALVLAQVQLPGPAPGIPQTEQLEQAGDGDVAEDIVAEHLHQVEHQLGPAAGESGGEPLHVAVDAEDGDAVAKPPERARHLGDDLIVILRVLVLAVEVGENGDLHDRSSSPMPQRASDTGRPP